MANTATIFHPAPTKDLQLFLCPYGLYANKELQNCEIGGTLIFADTWKQVKYRYVRSCKLPIKSSAFVFLLRSLYDDTMTYKRFMKLWEGVATSEGWGRHAFDTDNVLLIEIEKLDQ